MMEVQMTTAFPPIILCLTSTGETGQETEDEAKVFFAEPGRIHLVSNTTDPQLTKVLDWLVEDLYAPQGLTNNPFQYRQVHWEGFAREVVSVPAEDEHRVREFLAMQRFVVRRGTAIVYDEGKHLVFPFYGENFRNINDY